MVFSLHRELQNAYDHYQQHVGTLILYGHLKFSDSSLVLPNSRLKSRALLLPMALCSGQLQVETCWHFYSTTSPHGNTFLFQPEELALARIQVEIVSKPKKSSPRHKVHAKLMYSYHR